MRVSTNHKEVAHIDDFRGVIGIYYITEFLTRPFSATLQTKTLISCMLYIRQRFPLIDLCINNGKSYFDGLYYVA